MTYRKSQTAKVAVAAKTRPVPYGLAFGLLVVLALLASCGNQDDKIAFDGQVFRSKAKVVDKEKDHIEIEVRPVSASLDGAREAGRYEATRYCIANYGTSNVVWSLSPDAEESALKIENDTLLLQGVCTP